MLKKVLTPTQRAFIAISAFVFFFSAQVSLTIYVDSSYLKQTIESHRFFSQTAFWSNAEDAVGVLYAIGSLLTILALLYASRILRKIGNYRFTLSLLIFHILFLLALSAFKSTIFIVPLFITETAVIATLYFNIDVFLEKYSDDSRTGMIRGLYIMVSSIAWILPPIIAGKIADQFGFNLVYLAGAAIVCPTIFIVARYLNNFKDSYYDDSSLFLSISESQKHPGAGRIIASQFFLQFFYAWMIIYIPLYLHNEVGISFADIGFIITIALSAFILFPYISGWIADKILGEKEMLVGGFLLMGLSCLFIPYLTLMNAGLLLWVILFFVGRTGAAIVETMNETYFFKLINGENTGLMGQFRRTRPFAFITAPILATVLLKFNIVSLGNLFYVLGAIMICATYFPLRMKDTK